MITVIEVEYNKFKIPAIDNRILTGFKALQAAQKKWGIGRFDCEMKRISGKTDSLTLDTKRLTWDYGRNKPT